jgi:hypothetical protein
MGESHQGGGYQSRMNTTKGIENSRSMVRQGCG